MRVPIISDDLPDRFNKVAKYLGRHWPDEKLGLNKARERLAFLLGYNSVHEVNASAHSTVLPETISIADVHSSILIKALYEYKTHPNKLSIIYRLPFKELAFYAVSDEAKTKALVSRDRLSIIDEYASFSHYRTPSKLLEFKLQGFIPPYTYAVRENGTIFSSSSYEAIIAKLGDLTAAAKELDISERDLIHEYVLPIAWQDIHDFLDERSYDGSQKIPPTPLMVEIHRLRIDQVEKGFLLFHAGLNSYYPYIFSNQNDLTTALARLFRNQRLEEGAPAPLGRIEVAQCRRLNTEDYLLWEDIEISKGSVLSIDNQPFIKKENLRSYSKFYDNVLVKNFNWSRAKPPSVDERIVASSLLSDHMTIESNRLSMRNEALNRLSSASSDIIFEIVNLIAANGYQFSLSSLLKRDFGVEQGVGFDNSDRRRWHEIGEQVLELHSELRLFEDMEVLGYLFTEFESDMYGARNTFSCDERNVSFIAYILLQSPMLYDRTAAFDDSFFAVLLLSVDLVNGGSESFDERVAPYKELLRMLARHRKQENALKDIIRFHDFSKSVDPRFVSHGEVIEHRSESANDLLQKLINKGRKLSPKLFKQDISDLDVSSEKTSLTKGLPKDLT